MQAGNRGIVRAANVDPSVARVTQRIRPLENDNSSINTGRMSDGSIPQEIDAHPPVAGTIARSPEVVGNSIYTRHMTGHVTRQVTSEINKK